MSRIDNETSDGNSGSQRNRFAGSEPVRSNGSLPDRHYDTVPDRPTRTIPDRHTGMVPERQMVPDQTVARQELYRKRNQPGCIEFLYLYVFITSPFQAETGTMPRLLNMEL